MLWIGQLINALEPILVRVSGSWMLDNSAYEKQLAPMPVTVNVFPFHSTCSGMTISPRYEFSEAYSSSHVTSTVKSVNEVTL